MTDSDAHIQKRRIIDKVVIHIRRDPDLDDLRSSNKDNIEYIKHDLKEMIDYSGNTTEYHSDGLIEITPNYLQPIPNEIIEIIIQYLLDYHDTQQNQRLEQEDLYQLTLVSKQFYHQTNHLLWFVPYLPNADVLQRFQNSLAIARLTQSQTSFSDGLDKRTHDILNNIIMPRHHVRRLSLDGDHWDDVQFSMMVPQFSLLEDLTMINVGNRISVASIQNFPRYFPHLTYLSLRISHLTKTCMDAIAQYCHHIRQLDLPLNHLPPGTFKALADNDSCTTALQALRFFYMDSQTSNNRRIESISADMIKDMARFNCLTELTFDGANSPSPPNRVLTAITSKGTAAWPLLSYLSINNAYKLDEPSFIFFFKSHPYLRSIYIGASHLTDSTLDIMATHLPRLEDLSICHNTEITATAVYRLVQRCQDLEKTNFFGCTKLISSMPELSINKFHFTLAELRNIRQRGDQ